MSLPENPRSSPAAPPPRAGLRVWDLPTRLFHWSLLVCVVGAFVAINLDATDWHVRFGRAVLVLLLFRGVWGVVGGYWSRFLQFSYTPLTVFRYIRWPHQRGQHWEAGHSPLGALSVWAMLGLLSLQVLTGLMSSDDIAFSGPLTRFVSETVAGWAGDWHKDLGPVFLMGLVALHIGALIRYSRKGQRLVPAMITGDKPRDQLAPDTPESADTWPRRVLALVLVWALAVGVQYAWFWADSSWPDLSTWSLGHYLWPF